MESSHLWRLEYSPDTSLKQRAEAARLVIDHVRPQASTAIVDLLSALDELPDEVEDDKARLRKLVPPLLFRDNPSAPPLLGVRVPVGRAWDSFRSFAPYSVHAEVVDNYGAYSVALYDNAETVIIATTESSATELNKKLPTGVTIVRSRESSAVAAVRRSRTMSAEPVLNEGATTAELMGPGHQAGAFRFLGVDFERILKGEISLQEAWARLHFSFAAALLLAFPLQLLAWGIDFTLNGWASLISVGWEWMPAWMAVAYQPLGFVYVVALNAYLRLQPHAKATMLKTSNFHKAYYLILLLTVACQ